MPLRSIAMRHRGLLLLLTLHAVAFGAIVGVGSPFATASVECAAAVSVKTAMGQVRWPLLQSWDGLMGGMGLGALAGLPVLALTGFTGLGMKLTAYVGALATLVVVYLLLDRHALPLGRARRRAAQLAVAILAFGPPALLAPQLALGNWHWSQLFFDYGVALLALEALAAERGSLPGHGVGVGLRRGPGASGRAALWLGAGLATGVGLSFSLGSVPFVGVLWFGVGALLARSIGLRRAAMRAMATLAAAGIGLVPLFLKAATAPYGQPPRPDQTLQRLSRIHVDLSALADLFGPALADALHFGDVLPRLPGTASALGLVWATLLWLFVLAGARAGVATLLAALRSPSAPGAPGSAVPLAALVPLAYALAFGLVHVLIDKGSPGDLSEFSNLRDTAPRQLPPFLAALGVAAAIGAAAWAEHGRLGRVVHLAAFALPLLGGVGVLGMVDHAGRPAGNVASYRAACLDVTGFFAAPNFAADPLALQALCAAQPDPADARACAAGAAWGLGYYALAFESSTVALPHAWPPGELALAQSAADRCDALPAALGSRCLLGLGWHVGQLDWATARWPLAACSALEPDDQGPCWRGIGFHVGDHLHPQPHKLGQAVARVPPRRRPEVARGIGYSIGRTYADRALPDALCAAAGPLVEPGCRLGVDDALRDR